MDEAKAFGNRLRSVMTERGLIPLTLASNLGIPEHELNKYLKGEILPNEDLLSRMASTLHVPIANLRGNI
jgi:transcriptional regulator with XRE-family HTH domain